MHYDTRVRISVIALILMAVSHFGVAAEPEWETVEEVLAVVGSTPILLSDVELATLIRLIDPEPVETQESYRSRLLDARIGLEIEFRDIEDGGLLFRLELDPQRARETLIERGGGEAHLQAQFEERGLQSADLDELVLRVAAVDAYVHFARDKPILESIASSLTELFAAKIHSERIEGMLANYDFVDESMMAYFRKRLNQAPRDTGFALDYVKREAYTAPQQQAVLKALIFKTDVLWSQLDALHHAYVEPAWIPPGAFDPATDV